MIIHISPNLIIFEVTNQERHDLLNFVAHIQLKQVVELNLEYRDQQGVVCPHCGGTSHYWKQDKECYAMQEMR